MLNRLTLFVLFAFWAGMMFLLWRAEFAKELRSSLPAESVIQRILTAPDDSSMILYHRGERIGSMRWSASVGELLAAQRINSLERAPEGQIAEISEYMIDAEGAIYPGESIKPLKYDFRLTLSANRELRDFALRLRQRTDDWNFRATVQTSELTFGHVSDSGRWEKTIPFSDLKQPEKLLAEFGMPWATALLGTTLGLSPQQTSLENLSLGLNWEASLGYLPLGKSSVRSYRLSARLFDRFEVVIFVSRLGELLRVELPDGYVMVNERWTVL